MACNDQLSECSVRAARRLIARGHGRSAATGVPVGPDGQAVAWYTYPLLDFLDTIDTSDWSVVEFGSGQSTIYWSLRARKVVSFETNQEWVDKLKPRVPANAECIFAPTVEETSASLRLLQFRPDLVVVDGLQRRSCSEEALALFGRGSLYILDNSDWYLKAAEVFRRAGLIEIKFCGFGPVNNYAWCSSLWICGESIFHLMKTKPAMVTPAGLAAADTEERQDGIFGK